MNHLTIERAKELLAAVAVSGDSYHGGEILDALTSGHTRREAAERLLVTTLVVLFALGVAVLVGYGVAWQNASRVVGCEGNFPIMKDVVDYVRPDTGQIQRYICTN